MSSPPRLELRLGSVGSSVSRAAGPVSRAAAARCRSDSSGCEVEPRDLVAPPATDGEGEGDAQEAAEGVPGGEAPGLGVEVTLGLVAVILVCATRGVSCGCTSVSGGRTSLAL
jgi:hypothetical protein